MQTVELTYFKPSGKYYSHGTYQSSKDDINHYWDEIQEFQRLGSLPGLMPGGGQEFIILVGAPGHEHDHPKLIMPRYTRE